MMGKLFFLSVSSRGVLTSTGNSLGVDRCSTEHQSADLAAYLNRPDVQELLGIDPEWVGTYPPSLLEPCFRPHPPKNARSLTRLSLS